MIDAVQDINTDFYRGQHGLAWILRAEILSATASQILEKPK
jgi:hypothetical protein